jgi:hypothetical protein
MATQTLYLFASEEGDTGKINLHNLKRTIRVHIIPVKNAKTFDLLTK